MAFGVEIWLTELARRIKLTQSQISELMTRINQVRLRCSAQDLAFQKIPIDSTTN